MVHVGAPIVSTRLFLKKGPQRDTPPPSIHTASEDRVQRSEQRLYCARCGHWITSGIWRITVQGAHEHICTNPAGEIFTVACFQDAPGSLAFGAATAEYTWFPGFAWRVALCAACRTQLGWAYAGLGPPAAFFGLIPERLTDRGPEEDGSENGA